MYVSEEEIEAEVLRQGDIVKNVLRFGALNPGGITRGVGEDGEAVFWTVPKPPDYGHAMVVSHSCEIDPSNGIKLTSVILAPIRPVHEATPPDKVDDLIASNIVDQDGNEASFLKYFYLEPNSLFPFDGGGVVDFSKIFSVRRNYYDELVARKVLQLESSLAEKMALKLALYFYRTQS